MVVIVSDLSRFVMYFDLNIVSSFRRIADVSWPTSWLQKVPNSSVLTLLTTIPDASVESSTEVKAISFRP